MTTEELMQLSAEKAVQEMSWESIEYLFRPTTMLELLLRIDFDGMKGKIYAWMSDDSPRAMPHRFRDPYVAPLLTAIKVEEFYHAMKAAHDKKLLST